MDAFEIVIVGLEDRFVGVSAVVVVSDVDVVVKDVDIGVGDRPAANVGWEQRSNENLEIKKHQRLVLCALLIFVCGQQPKTKELLDLLLLLMMFLFLFSFWFNSSFK